MNTEQQTAFEVGSSSSVALTTSERTAIVEILGRRANEIASFKMDLEHRLSEQSGKSIRLHELPGSVELALSREIKRLRRIADKVKPSQPEQGEDEE